jgi:hypothetical protein
MFGQFPAISTRTPTQTFFKQQPRSNARRLLNTSRHWIVHLKRPDQGRKAPQRLVSSLLAHCIRDCITTSVILFHIYWNYYWLWFRWKRTFVLCRLFRVESTSSTLRARVVPPCLALHKQPPCPRTQLTSAPPRLLLAVLINPKT